MKIHQYSRGIRIWTVDGLTLDTAQDLPQKVEDAFINLVREALETLGASSTGKALLSEIDGCGKTVTIFSGKGATGTPYPADEQSMQARLLSRLVPESMVTKSSQQALDVFRPSNQQQRVKREKTELTMTLDRAAQAGMKRKKVASLLGISESQLKSVEELDRRVTPSQYFLLLLHLLPWIKRGPGCNVAIKLDASLAPKHADPTVYKADWSKSPMHLILGHELIHAWRMMTGQRFYQMGYEEEAMTVGLSPFHKMRFTENRLRTEFKYAVAPKYGSYSGQTNSALAEGHRKIAEQPEKDKATWREFLEKATEWRGRHDAPIANVKGKSVTFT